MPQERKPLLEKLKTAEGSRAEFVRFVLNGIVAAGVHYGVYLLGLLLIGVVWAELSDAAQKPLATVSYVVGYIVSFLVNFYFSCLFTFRKTPTLRLFLGFSGSHVVNFFLQVALFHVCMVLGVHKLLAPIVSMGIAMLVQFTLLRFVFHRS